jgi:hypothetical protein
VQISESKINELLDIWAADVFHHKDSPPFADCKDVYNTIDSIPLGDVPWQSFAAGYQGQRPDIGSPPWMDSTYEVLFRDPLAVVHNMLRNPDFNGEFDYVPFWEYKANGERCYQDFFSGDWVWMQAVRFYSSAVPYLTILQGRHY